MNDKFKCDHTKLRLSFNEFHTVGAEDMPEYGEFLDRYLELVPGGSFGMFKEDLLPNKELRAFLGY